MTPAQRQQLAAIERRGFFFPEARSLAQTMQRIDNRAPLRRSFKAARHARHRELLGAFVIIAACIAAALFL